LTYPGRGGIRRRRSRRRRRVRLIRKVAVATGLLAILLTAGLLLTHRTYLPVFAPAAAEWSPNPSVNLALLAAQSHSHEHSALPQRPARPVYKYSVVPGGVRSGTELRDAAARDQSVAAHYAQFRYDRAQTVRLKEARLVYLSYRMNGRILWTKARHRLPEGETVLTDGDIVARTRCANQISVRKQLPVAEAEPTAAQLEEVIPQSMPPVRVDIPAQFHSALLSSPIAPGGPPTGGSPIGAPPLLGGVPGIPPPLPVAGGGTCEPPAGEDGQSQDNPCPPATPPPTTPPPAPVPEPGSILLVSSGLAAVIAAYRKRQLRIRN
jgi:hypothetical protein